MSMLESLHSMRYAYTLSLEGIKKALDELQFRYNVIQEQLEKVEEAIAYNKEVKEYVMRYPYTLSLEGIKKALDELQFRYNVIQEQLEKVEEAIAYNKEVKE